MLDTKDWLLILIGIAGGVVANYLFKQFDSSGNSAKELSSRLGSTNAKTKADAVKYCLLVSAKWYLIANIFWVVSGSSWAFVGALKYDAVQIILGASSAIAIFFFAIALRWLLKVVNAYRT